MYGCMHSSQPICGCSEWETRRERETRIIHSATETVEAPEHRPSSGINNIRQITLHTRGAGAGAENQEDEEEEKDEAATSESQSRINISSGKRNAMLAGCWALSGCCCCWWCVRCGYWLRFCNEPACMPERDTCIRRSRGWRKRMRIQRSTREWVLGCRKHRCR